MASIYRRDGEYLLHASSETTQGVWVASAPFTKLPANASDDDLTKAVLGALDGSRQSVPHPVDWGGVLLPLLRLAGARSWRAFSKAAQCAEVEDDGVRYHVFRTRNLGPSQGFERDPAWELALERADMPDEALGAAVRNALSGT